MAKKKLFFSLPRGMRDMLPKDHSVASYLKKAIRYRCRQAGVLRISTPLFERTVILENLPPVHWGEHVQVRYSPTESNDLLLRKNFMLGMLRAYTTHKMYNLPQPVELYSLDMCFRADHHWAENDQTVLEQFLGLDIEILGEDDPVLDAQSLKLWYLICKDVGLEERLVIKLSKIGTAESRRQYLEDFHQYYTGKERSLCAKCAQSLQNNDIFALLRCVEEDCQILLKLAPVLENYFDAETRDFYHHLEEYMHILGVPFTWESNLFPTDLAIYEPLYGEIHLDDKMIGQLTHFTRLMADDSFEGISGRSLLVNLEAVIIAMQKHHVFVPYKDNIHVYIAQLGVEGKKRGLALLYALRDQGIKAIASMGKGSMHEQVDIAYKLKIPYSLVLGRMEVAENVVIVRDMNTGKRETIPYDQVIDFLLAKIPAYDLDKVSYAEEERLHYEKKLEMIE
ncbi:ATP phosphoribosyltransferase regulatory subunit [Candidatus Gracilibacteria bacterium]|nr:ATP phosphoribosyltransferase regulatory subunit [Candidatus Gracilibacteria bacterium]